LTKHRRGGAYTALYVVGGGVKTALFVCDPAGVFCRFFPALPELQHNEGAGKMINGCSTKDIEKLR
jgi:hypothetical protein